MPDAERLYGIVVVVVVFSVLVQGSLVPTVARPCCGCRCAPSHPEPWALGVRLGDEPEGVAPADHHHRRPGGRAAHRRAHALPGDAWISLVVRDNRLVPVRGDSRLQAGDEILVLADPGSHADLVATFRAPP